MKKLYKYLQDLLNNIDKKSTAQREKEEADNLQREARRLYQITEYQGDIWITFKGEPIVPSYELGDKHTPIEWLAKIRGLWIKAHSL